MSRRAVQSAVNPVVFFTSVILIFIFILTGVLFPAATESFFGAVQQIITDYLGWLYILAVAFFLLFIAVLFFSPYGDRKLGPDDSVPDYSYMSWFSMLFSAGMGIGLVFFSVAEPVQHYINPPGMPGETTEAATQALPITFFHWGFHAWGIYIIAGLSLAYFSFRRGLPLSIRSAFYPMLGDRIYGPIGNLVDILAIFGTLFGVATSLGLGVMQVNAGLGYLTGLEESVTMQILLIAGITVVASISVVLGLKRGIRRLSNFNMICALLLLITLLAVGPTVFIIESFVENTGRYLQYFLENTFRMDSMNQNPGWMGEWTLFYWGWWVAWSPFVGMFIARISRGRTIREFIAGVLLVPTAVTLFWLSVFGSTGIYLELFGGGGLAGLASEEMIFAMFGHFPFPVLTSLLASIVVITFFVTSSDSASLVIDILASGGNTNPSKRQRVFWALLEGLVAAVLLYAGGLTALRMASITTGLPFAIVLILMCFNLYKALKTEEGPPEEVSSAQDPVPPVESRLEE